METPQTTPQPEIEKVKKPFYKKWWFLTIVGILVLGMFLPDSKDSQKPEVAAIAAKDNAPVKAKLSEIDQARADIKTVLEGMDELVARDYKTLDEAKAGLVILELYQRNYLTYESLEGKDKELDKDLANYKKALIPALKKQYPKLRTAYASAMKSLLWQDNIDVQHSGKTVKLIGGTYASNKNIQETQTAISQMVKSLRFKKVSYAWYDGADGSYYDLDTPNDSEIAIQ